MVKNFISQKGLSREIPPIVHENKIVSDNKEKANLFNNYFASQSKLDNPDDDVPDLPYIDHEITDIYTTEQEITNIITV